jgi:hypothetical protein
MWKEKESIKTRRAVMYHLPQWFHARTDCSLVDSGMDSFGMNLGFVQQKTKPRVHLSSLIASRSPVNLRVILENGYYLEGEKRNNEKHKLNVSSL